ncbi:GNAT family N-acetyltransferase [Endozoicomonas sp. 4G]|uniref:GNAT family N-acetyltransferase n=1 Tax=Endozoicomonas sp. 4G TaxID=2872754 RepID=UPI0020789C4D|nr:GNAT family N-acetyltransferase [Endozoicomonas sp. 4G]
MQKNIEVEGESYLTGPRYFGGDIKRPFIELIASSSPLTESAIREIFRVWQPLGATSLQILRPAGIEEAGNIDQLFYARSIPKQVTETTSSKSKILEKCDPSHLDWCMSTINAAYQATHKQQPQLSELIFPAEEEDIRAAIADGHAFIIHYDSKPAGFISCDYRRRSFLTGHWITEEVVLPEYRGKQLAAAAQSELIRLLGSESESTLLGTINNVNIPSIRTAERAGRRAILEYVFLEEADIIRR